ncbi:hypothetical protein BFF78_40425 [Streptomyces fodineus]|uniref:Uncharacterized protein n=1 Tax=Streptomyces fodineus TaxID=1904616 RepID=A0A1D7YM88_9ACTN|nr:DUF2891 family protein [Streptomyces fodineus]AOR36499.1 hypothetical protein BFF78_40425 [Streptomyces fodineus]
MPLAAECRAYERTVDARRAEALAPAVTAVDTLLAGGLPKATYPVRHGEPPQQRLRTGLLLGGANCPALTEADAMRRVLGRGRFAQRLDRFPPAPRSGAPGPLPETPVVSDHADSQIGHLLGLTVSRAA